VALLPDFQMAPNNQEPNLSLNQKPSRNQPFPWHHHNKKREPTPILLAVKILIPLVILYKGFNSMNLHLMIIMVLISTC
jgi:hypothetical protein